MPELGPLGRGGARRRTRRRMSSANEMQNEQNSTETSQMEKNDEVEKIAKLLKSNGIISEDEYDLIFG